MKGPATLALRLCSLVLGFGSGLYLARTLGPSGLGVYESAMAWATIFAIPLVGGLDRWTIRETAAALGTDALARARGIARFGLRRLLLRSLLLAALGALAIVLWNRGQPLPIPLLLGLCAVAPLQSWLIGREAVLQGTSLVLQGQIGRRLIAPLVFFVLVVGIGSTTTLEPKTALALQVAALATGGLFATIAVLRDADRRYRETTAEPVSATAIRALRPLLILAALRAFDDRLDVLVLDLFRADDEVGRFATANRLAAPLGLVLIATNTVLGPKIAALHARGEKDAMQREVTTSARRALWLMIPTAGAALLIAPYLLRLLGTEFESAVVEHRILTAAQVGNVLAGSVSLLLVMTGHEREATRGLAISTLAHLLLACALIPAFGSRGAAIANGAEILLWNALLARSVRRKLGLEPSALGRL